MTGRVRPVVYRDEPSSDSRESGFSDLPLAEAQAKYETLAKLCVKNDWFVRPDPRELT